MRTLCLTLLIAGAHLLAAKTHAATIANGGFETGDLTGWTLSGNTDFIGVGLTCPVFLYQS
ncbi:MAG TPA: hypothetical protein VJ731_11355 [Terriglobales bacterium]|nr:hypothetical protein [Terriglobales bacterium]